MSKAILIGAATFVVLCLGTYVIVTNSHIDIFPGVDTVRDYETGELVRTERAISILAHRRGYDLQGEGAELTAMGYVVEILVVVVLPLVIGAVVFCIVKRTGGPKPADPPAA